MEAKPIDYLSAACLFDDRYFELFFKDSPQCMEVVIQTIFSQLTGLSKVRIKSLQVQVDLFAARNYHNARFDALVEDSFGNLIDVEIQNVSDANLLKRARYYSAILDTNSLKQGEDYNNLRDNFIIFITLNDIFNAGKPAYRIERTNLDNNCKIVGDGSHIIWINASVNDGSPISKLMEDFKNKGAESMNNNVLAERTKYIKETPEGAREYHGIEAQIRKEGIDEGLAKGLVKGQAEGQAKERVRNILTLLNSLNGDCVQVSKLLNCSLVEVQEVANNAKSQ